MGRDEQIGRMIREAMAGMHGNMARDIAQAWCSIAEQKQHLLCRIKELESRLELLDESIAGLENDARRWKEVAFGSNPFLGVLYVDSFGNELMLWAQDAIDVVDKSIKTYQQKD